MKPGLIVRRGCGQVVIFTTWFYGIVLVRFIGRDGLVGGGVFILDTWFYGIGFIRFLDRDGLVGGGVRNFRT